MVYHEFNKRLISELDNMKEDLSKLIEIKSVGDIATKSENAPFGSGIRKAFDKMIEFAIREDLEFEDFNGYAMHIDYGEGPEIIAMLGHLDIVDIFDSKQWQTPPFQLTELSGYWFGRGVNDNKGPMIGCLYLMKIMKDMGCKPKKKIRLILGGAEETTWECMKHYFKFNPKPQMGFSPDGNFPIINCEKGIDHYKFKSTDSLVKDNKHVIISVKSPEDITRVCSHLDVIVQSENPTAVMSKLDLATKVTVIGNEVEIQYRGKTSMGRNPHRGENAIFKFVGDFKEMTDLDSRSHKIIGFLDSYFVDSLEGEKLGLAHKDPETGKTTCNLAYIQMDNLGCELGFDFRYPLGVERYDVYSTIESIASINQFTMTRIKTLDRLYLHPEDPFIQGLQQAYRTVTGENAETRSIGAASYARTLPCAVAFGPTFEGEKTYSHQPNERIKIHDLINALCIYYAALKNLTD
jgi:predicted dipeptidase